MSAESSAVRSASSGIRVALGIGGLVALIVGILVLVWPGHTAVVLTWFIALYAVIAGLVYVGIGIFSSVRGGWSRVGHIVLGVLFIIAGVLMFANLKPATTLLFLYFGIFVGIVWIIEGIVALSTLGASSSKGLTVVFAILSIIAGIILLFSPLMGSVVLWWLLGISLVVLGIVQIVRAFSWKSVDA